MLKLGRREDVDEIHQRVWQVTTSLNFRLGDSNRGGLMVFTAETIFIGKTVLRQKNLGGKPREMQIALERGNTSTTRGIEHAFSRTIWSVTNPLTACVVRLPCSHPACG